MLRIIVIAPLIACISCNNGHRVNTMASSDADTSSFSPFAGTWVNQGYIDLLLKTKSPRSSQGHEELFYFPQLLKDIGYSAVFHEGGDQFVVVKHGSSYFLKFSDDSSLISIVNEHKIGISGKTYILISGGSDDFKVSEHFLFKGLYSLGDRLVELKGNGEISGLDTIKYYNVWHDYIGPGSDMDMLDLGSKKSKTLSISLR